MGSEIRSINGRRGFYIADALGEPDPDYLERS